ncbi:rhomboid family intramembrane serine protease [Phenylobacterium sp.]|uniref:rhomboid family intramembrane serine protease n=1 Tax=Phenylobacterium sp. TaxID=1871053 RepID=UPI002600CCA2|nr:rhomboid family intramembrane serine protease [Phenylobacterium sp.]
MNVLHFEAPAPGGSGTPRAGEPGYRPAPEPMVNAPWPVVAVTLGIVAAYAVQSRFDLQQVEQAFAFSPPQLLGGHPERLVSSMFVHGNWSHALMNAGFCLAFGAPVARLLGRGAGGAAAYFLFFLTTGIVATLGFAAVHWGQGVSVIGASGAASGLMGGAARIIGGQGRVGRMFSPAVLQMGAAWVVINLIMAVSGSLLVPGGGDALVGWEAHLAGFAAGVLLIGPFAWLAGRR